MNIFFDEEIQRVLNQELRDCLADSYKTTVVSAVTKEGIVRAITSWTSQREMIEAILATVGIMNADSILEWSFHEYRTPSYLRKPDTPAPGVYLFRWNEPEHWTNPKRRMSRTEPILLYRPRSWGNGDYPISSDDPDYYNSEVKNP